MNKYHTDMFNALEHLVSTNEAFYRQEFELDSKRYWIYNYRLASFTDFEQPFGRECRGHMFEVDEHDEPVRLACLPMHKFHNLNECPTTMNVDLSTVDSIYVKSDGSLISTFSHKGSLRLKSKGSLSSDQVVDAWNWLSMPTQRKLYDWLHFTTVMLGMTVNMEWVAPQNRIVLGYLTPQLVILNTRVNSTGEYLFLDDEMEMYRYCEPEVIPVGISNEEFVKSVPNITDNIEGFVCITTDGLWFKVKTNKYLSLHRAKDSIQSPRRLFEVILDEGIDDIRSMFFDDELVIHQIDNMQKLVDHKYNHLVKTVESFCEENKHLTRKDFAIKGQQDLSGLYFKLAMQRYLGTMIDYKAFMKQKHKEFGIKDEIKDISDK